MIFDKLFKRKEEEPKTWYIPNNTAIIQDGLLKKINYVDLWQNPKQITLGENAFEYPIFLDTANLPHLLVSGATGSGKSVCINSILLQLLIKNCPYDMKLYFIDPKKVDYIKFKDLPHTKAYCTELDESIMMLKELHSIMMQRFEVLQQYKVDKIQKVPLKYSSIYIVFDEFASFINVKAKRELFPILQDIARLSRAVDIHIILATQRPDRTIIDGQLKANIPTRISFRLPSATDSRTILDRKGAEQLNGCGDGLIVKANGDFEHFQGLYFDDEQTDYIISWWMKQI